METARNFTLRLQDLLRRERVALADFLVALAEFDGRRLWVELGHTSLFYFLHRDLGLSKGAAFYRKTAAELIQRFPEVAEALREGELCLTSVVELSKVLTPENRDEVLPRFLQLSKRQAKEVSAELRPQVAPLRDVVTMARARVADPALALPAQPDLGQAVHPANQPELAPSRGEPADPAVVAGLANSPPLAEPAALPAQARPDTVEPLTAEASRFHVTVSRRFLQKLKAARAALSHSHPGADAHEILEAGLDLLLEKAAKRKGLVAKPRREPPRSKADHVPAHVRRAVWKRDGGKCQWSLASGGICGSTVRLQLDHVVPRARGGPSTIDNLRICCAFHNDLAAREIYGDAWMDRFTRGGRRGARATTAPAESP